MFDGRVAIDMKMLYSPQARIEGRQGRV